MFKKLESLISRKGRYNSTNIEAEQESTKLEETKQYPNKSLKLISDEQLLKHQLQTIQKQKQTFEPTSSNFQTQTTISIEKEVTSNLDGDGAQALFTVGFSNGSIEVFDLLGNQKSTIQLPTAFSIKMIKFFPNKPFIIACDLSNVVYLINYHNQKTWVVNEPSDIDREEHFVQFFISDIMNTEAQTSDYAFLGTNRGNIYIFSVSQVDFVSSIQNQTSERNVSIAYLGSNPYKPHRVLIVYRSNYDSTSMVVVYSINKQKEIQKFNFNQKTSQQLGSAICASFSPDALRICILFTSGMIQVFKAHQKMCANQSQLVQEFALNINGSCLEQASLQWKNRDNDKDKFICMIYYQYQNQSITYNDIALFFCAPQFANPTLLYQGSNQKETIKDAILIDYSLLNQRDEIIQTLQSIEGSSKKQKTQQKQFLESQMLFLITSDNNILCQSINFLQHFSIESSHQQTSVQLYPQKIKEKVPKLIHTFVEIQSKSEIDQQLSNCIESFQHLYVKEQLGKIISEDKLSSQVISKKASNIATKLDIFYHFNSAKHSSSFSNIIGYSFHISNETQILYITKVQQTKAFIIAQIELASSFASQSPIVKIDIDLNATTIQFGLENGKIYDLKKCKKLLIQKKQQNEIEYLGVSEVKNINLSKDSKLILMESLFQCKTNLLILGHNDGTVKIINKLNKKLLITHQIQTIDQAFQPIPLCTSYCAQQNELYVYVGDSLGGITEFKIYLKEVSQIERYQVFDLESSEQIKHILANNDEKYFYVMTKTQIVSLDKNNLRIKRQFELQQLFGSKVCFQNRIEFMHFNITTNSILCHLSNKLVLLLNLENLNALSVYNFENIDSIRSFCFYPLMASGYLHALAIDYKSQKVAMISFQNNLSQMKQNVIFNTNVLAKPKVKPLGGRIMKLFQKKITIGQCIAKADEKIKNKEKAKRSRSLIIGQNVSATKMKPSFSENKENMMTSTERKPLQQPEKFETLSTKNTTLEGNSKSNSIRSKSGSKVIKPTSFLF